MTNFRARVNFVAVLIILALSAALAGRVHAADYHLVDVREVSLGYKNFALLNDKARNALIYPDHPKESLSMNLKLDVFRAGYLEAGVESYTDSAQYQSVGLEVRLGMRITDFVQLGYFHHSQHVLDRPHAFMDKFPVEDAMELKFTLIRAHTPEKGLF